MKSVIPLGECPFCGGNVTVGVNEYDSETGMVYFSYDDQPQCENGCPVGRFDCQRCCFDDIRVTAEKDAAPVFRKRWRKEVEALRNRPACPDCGKRLYPFGEGRTADVAKQYGLPMLAQLPIQPELAKKCDEGRLMDIQLPEMGKAVDAVLKCKVRKHE